jgi:hypothetical protein
MGKNGRGYGETDTDVIGRNTMHDVKKQPENDPRLPRV